MVYLPVRKCYHAAKFALLFMLVIAILTLFEYWRGGKRSARAALSDPLEAEYEKQILADEARIIPGLGEGGAAAYLTGEDKLLGEESEKKLAINVHLSDRIPYNRTLKDYRNPACSRVVYDAELPSASVILIFHNEPYSVVVRTVWSVINSARRDQPWYKQANFVDRESGRTMNLGYPGQNPSSPFVYLKEIILVDDNSTLPELKGKLSHYVRTRLPPDLIRILRLPDRVGLTQARLAGSRVARGDVIVFLDAHCEGVKDWLRPLLHRIKHHRTTVVTPVIDMVEQDTFEYQTGQTDFEGLMMARMKGARMARGDVLIFLDAHCEGSSDWLRPLLQRVRHKRDAVATPIIDVIAQSTLHLEASENFQVGGFTFMGHFTWIDVPEWEKKRRGSDISPTWSPTMAGGLFAINRAYYWELGAYDEQMAGWGGENLEMSFRIWQCGGTLETIPCSRVGHVFRSFHPYGMPANSDTHGINTARMAEVWMDEYAELFYLHRPDLRKNPKIGDVTHRKILREKLKCKSFQWYLDNIYKEKFVPVRDVYGYGRFSNPASGLCLDSLQRDSEAAPLGVYPCHEVLQATQYLALSLAGELRDEEKCAQLQYKRRNPDEVEDTGRRVLMSTCRHQQPGQNQKWVYLPTGQIQHYASKLCLDAGVESGSDVLAKTCSDTASQKWKIDYSEDNDFRLENNGAPSDRDERLRKLRGQRRISRSLLSHSDNDANKIDDTDDPTVRRHSHKSKKHRKRSKKAKKKHTKNKFILKLVRTLMNNTEDHLEVDIHCKHKQLYPNNTFVRDLVTILNEKNIKVINNGRVFERNKVTQLSRTQAHAGPRERLRDQIQPVPSTEQVTKKVRRKKLKPSTTSPASVASFADVAQQAGDVAPHRIIIEDFVEVTSPTTAKTERIKKRKRKHSRATPSPSPAAAAPARLAPARLAHKRPSHAHELVRIPPTFAEESMKVETPLASMEDTPMAASDESKRDGDTAYDAPEGDGDGASENEDWPIGESRFRRNNTNSVSPLRRHRHSHKHADAISYTDANANPRVDTNAGNDIDAVMAIEGRKDPMRNEEAKAEDARLLADALASYSAKAERAQSRDGESEREREREKQAGESESEAPVRVVMRSNLTFHLGDEFFDWRARPDPPDDPSNLAIPTNMTREVPPAHAWILPTREQVGERIRQLATNQVDEHDTISTTHGRVAAKAEDGAEGESSSSSDSGSDS